MAYNYLYVVILPETGEFYIGSRKTDNEPHLDTNYMGSMCKWKPDKTKLVKEIIEIFPDTMSRVDFINEESKLIKQSIHHPLNRNYSVPNGHMYVESHSEETKKKMSETARKRPPVSDETRMKLSRINTGKTLSLEHKAKLAIASTGQVLSLEARKKISDAKKNLSIETRKKLADASRGHIMSMESRLKMSNTKLNNNAKKRAMSN